MAHLWRGVIREYAERLPLLEGAPVVTLQEGGTPLIEAEHLSELTGARVFVKFEGLNPTGSFKDRGMTAAISLAAKHGAKAVICASTGNTSASAAAYATKAGMTCGVLVPEGKIAMGKLSQAIAHGATLLQVDGNFDDCLTLARKLAEAYPVELVNSVNPARIEGQKTASFEVVDALGDAPTSTACRSATPATSRPTGRGYREYAAGHGLAGVPDGVASRLPQMWGFQAAGAAPIVLGTPSTTPRPSRRRSASATPPRGSRPSRPATSPADVSRRSPTSRSWPRTGCSRAARGSSSSRARQPAWPACSWRTRQGTCRLGPPWCAP